MCIVFVCSVLNFSKYFIAVFLKFSKTKCRGRFIVKKMELNFFKPLIGIKINGRNYCNTFFLVRIAHPLVKKEVKNKFSRSVMVLGQRILF